MSDVNQQIVEAIVARTNAAWLEKEEINTIQTHTQNALKEKNQHARFEPSTYE